MSRAATNNVRNAKIFGLLVCAGVLLRWACQDLPNFAPVAGLALFAGYYFRNTLLAIAVPLSVMIISDRFFMGGYDGGMMIAVYASLTLPVAMQWMIRRNADFRSNRLRSIVRTTATVFGCSMAASLLFFVTTNLAVWMFSELYPTNWFGLTTCFTQAIPFFRYTFAGDLIFSTALFGSYAVCVNLASLTRPAVVTNPS